VIDLSLLRERVAQRLEDEGRSDLAEPLRECGAVFELLCTSCGTPRVVSKSCKKRWCPSCARMISLSRLEKYQSAIDRMHWPMMVTLTMPHTMDTSCPSDVRKIKRALGKLRRLRWFKKKVRGGISSVEVTAGDNGWHPHAHLLIDCQWLSVTTKAPTRHLSPYKYKKAFRDARNEVAQQWQLCLQESKRLQVHISRARPEAAREVLKYAVKPQDLADAPMPLAPLIDILRVSRLISAFGSVRASNLAELQGQGEEDKQRYFCSCGCADFMPDFVLDKLLCDHRDMAQKSRIVSFSSSASLGH